MTGDDVTAIERATLAAVPPSRQAEIDGWLLGFDPGTVGRAASAVPLAHGSVAPGVRQRIEVLYREEGRPPKFRIARVGAFVGLCADLEAAGYAPDQPTLVQVARVDDVLGLAAPAVDIALADKPERPWADLLLGGGFDPVDAASRLAILARAEHSVFATASIEGKVAAVGSACFSHGWCGVHAMRTAPAARGRGLASALLVALAREAARRGVGRAFLQVEESNAAAQSLYRRAGFAGAWTYEYWGASD